VALGLTRALRAGGSVESMADDLNQAIIRAARAHRNAAATMLAEHGLYPGQEQVLLLVTTMGTSTQAALAQALRVEAPTMAKIVRRMVDSGFLQRTPSPTDARAWQVSLTPAGRRTSARITELWDDLERRTGAGLSSAERQQLDQLLERVAGNLGAGQDPSCHPLGDACGAPNEGGVIRES